MNTCPKCGQSIPGCRCHSIHPPAAQPQCACGLALITALHDTPHRDAGVQPVAECSKHGSWIKFDMVYLHLVETLEALGVQEKRAETAEAERTTIHGAYCDLAELIKKANTGVSGNCEALEALIAQRDRMQIALTEIFQRKTSDDADDWERGHAWGSTVAASIAAKALEGLT